MAPKITPEVLTATSRFLKTIRNFRGTYAELANRIAAGRAGVVNVGGADAGEFFDDFLKTFGLPLSVLGLSCDRGPGPRELTVVGYANDVPGGGLSEIPGALNQLSVAIAPQRRDVYGFEFAAGNPGSFEAGLGVSGGGQIRDIFVIAHGFWLGTYFIEATVLGADEESVNPARPGKIFVLSGIPIAKVVEICVPYLTGACLHILACDLPFDILYLAQEKYGVDVDCEVPKW